MHIESRSGQLWRQQTTPSGGQAETSLVYILEYQRVPRTGAVRVRISSRVLYGWTVVVELNDMSRELVEKTGNKRARRLSLFLELILHHAEKA